MFGRTREREMRVHFIFCLGGKGIIINKSNTSTHSFFCTYNLVSPIFNIIMANATARVSERSHWHCSTDPSLCRPEPDSTNWHTFILVKRKISLFVRCHNRCRSGCAMRSIIATRGRPPWERRCVNNFIDAQNFYISQSIGTRTMRSLGDLQFQLKIEGNNKGNVWAMGIYYVLVFFLKKVLVRTGRNARSVTVNFHSLPSLSSTCGWDMERNPIQCMRVAHRHCLCLRNAECRSKCKTENDRKSCRIKRQQTEMTENMQHSVSVRPSKSVA